MAQPLRAQAALAEDAGLILSTQGGSQSGTVVPGDLMHYFGICCAQTCMQRKHMYVCKMKCNKRKFYFEEEIRSMPYVCIKYTNT